MLANFRTMVVVKNNTERRKTYLSKVLWNKIINKNL